jgi:hypothetical protein
LEAQRAENSGISLIAPDDSAGLRKTLRIREGGSMKLFRIALALVCCGAGAAKADWKYTKWGMTPDQVASAAKNQTKNSSDLHPDSDGNVTKLVAPFPSGKFSFEAQFGFNPADRLSSVTLVLNDKSAGMDMAADMNMNLDHKGGCHDLLVSVKITYGPPQGGGSAHALYTIQTWRDQTNKNDVKYTVLDGVGCYVQYSAIKPAGAH